MLVMTNSAQAGGTPIGMGMTVSSNCKLFPWLLLSGCPNKPKSKACPDVMVRCSLLIIDAKGNLVIAKRFWHPRKTPMSACYAAFTMTAPAPSKGSPGGTKWMMSWRILASNTWKRWSTPGYYAPWAHRPSGCQLPPQTDCLLVN